MSLIKSLSTTTLNSFLIPVRAGVGIASAYLSATTFYVDSAVGIHIGDKFKATGGADRYGTISDISGLTIAVENVSDITGVAQALHTSMTKVLIGYTSDIDSPVNSATIVNSKVTAKRLKVKAGRVVTVLGSDGGHFYGVTGAAVSTHVDDVVNFCGTKFIPTGGDGSSAWLRVYSGEVNIVWFGAKVDGLTDDTTAFNACVLYCNANNKVLTANPGTCLLTPGGVTADISCSVNAPYTAFKAATSANSPLFSVVYSAVAASAGKSFSVGSLQGSIAGTSGVATGLYIKHSEYSRFVIREINSLATGLWLGGLVANSRIARNEFSIGKIYTCTDGLLVTSGVAASLLTELNIFNINSIHNCTANLVNVLNSSVNVINANIFNIAALEINVANAVGIRVASVGQKNVFNVSGVLNGDSGTGKLVVAAGSDNIFNLPTVDWTKITDVSNANKYYQMFGASQAFTATFVGFTTSFTTTARIARAGNLVTVTIDSNSGTSNSTAFKLTGLPAWAWPSTAQYFSVLVYDNGANIQGSARVESIGDITFYVGPALGGFTASGIKGFATLTFTYLLN